MLELDHLLQGFLDRGYRDLDAASRTEFVALLDNQDQDLSDWFMSRRVPEDPGVRDLVRHIVAVVTPKADLSPVRRSRRPAASASTGRPPWAPIANARRC